MEEEEEARLGQAQDGVGNHLAADGLSALTPVPSQYIQGAQPFKSGKAADAPSFVTRQHIIFGCTDF
jgi:hypothetical protein